MLLGLLAVLSAAAAAGLRVALPLLTIGLLSQENWWSNVPLLSAIPPRVLLAILTSWSLFELLGSKRLLGQRSLQAVELLFSPLVGGLLAVTVSKITELAILPVWLIGILGGGIALVLKLVEIGWFFRLRGIPLWVAFAEDALCIVLVFLAFEAPREGGIIAMLLVWLAVRSASEWQAWYWEHRSASPHPPKPKSPPPA